MHGAVGESGSSGWARENRLGRLRVQQLPAVVAHARQISSGLSLLGGSARTSGKVEEGGTGIRTRSHGVLVLRLGDAGAAACNLLVVIAATRASSCLAARSDKSLTNKFIYAASASGRVGLRRADGDSMCCCMGIGPLWARSEGSGNVQSSGGSSNDTQREPLFPSATLIQRNLVSSQIERQRAHSATQRPSRP